MRTRRLRLFLFAARRTICSFRARSPECVNQSNRRGSSSRIFQLTSVFQEFIKWFLRRWSLGLEVQQRVYWGNCGLVIKQIDFSERRKFLWTQIIEIPLTTPASSPIPNRKFRIPLLAWSTLIFFLTNIYTKFVLLMTFGNKLGKANKFVK